MFTELSNYDYEQYIVVENMECYGSILCSQSSWISLWLAFCNWWLTSLSMTTIGRYYACCPFVYAPFTCHSPDWTIKFSFSFLIALLYALPQSLHNGEYLTRKVRSSKNILLVFFTHFFYKISCDLLAVLEIYFISFGCIILNLRATKVGVCPEPRGFSPMVNGLRSNHNQHSLLVAS